MIADNDILRKLAIDTYNEKDKSSFKDTQTSFVSNDEISMRSHNDCYTKILEAYSFTLKKNIEDKYTYKKRFFYCCIAILLLIAFTLIGCLISNLVMIFMYPHIQFDIKSIIALMATLATAFISSFMIIPKIITQYLFNLNEEKNMMDIIKNIQTHDLKIRDDIKE